MAQANTSLALVGSTGLVGSQILALLSTLPSTTTHVLARRQLPSASSSNSNSNNNSSIIPHISPETSTWPSTLTALSPPARCLFSALGTTKGAAGSAEAQFAIDHDLNLALARAALQASTTTTQSNNNDSQKNGDGGSNSSNSSVYVLISTASASSKSSFFYPRMKGQLEDEVGKLGFAHLVVLRPGVLLGGKRHDSRPAEALVRGVAGALRGLTGGRATDFWAQDAEVVARAAVRAGLACVNGKRQAERGLWELGQADIVRLGSAAWKGGEEDGAL